MRRIDRVFHRQVLPWAPADVVESWVESPASNVFWAFVWMELADDPGLVSSSLKIPSKGTIERLCDWYKEMGAALEDLSLERAVETAAQGGRIAKEEGLDPASDAVAVPSANVIGAVRALLHRTPDELKERVRESAEFALSMAEIDAVIEEELADVAEAVGRGTERVARWLGTNETTIRRLRPYEEADGREHSRASRRALEQARRALRDYLG